MTYLSCIYVYVLRVRKSVVVQIFIVPEGITKYYAKKLAVPNFHNVCGKE